MVYGREYDLVTYQRIISDVDSSLVLKATSRVNEDILAKMKIHSEISIYWWEYLQSLADLFLSQLAHQFLYFALRMVLIVYLANDLLGSIGRLVHEALRFPFAIDISRFFYQPQIFFSIHYSSYSDNVNVAMTSPSPRASSQ